MIVVGIETSSGAASVAVLRDEQVLAEKRLTVVGQAAETLLGVLEESLIQACITKADIGRIAVGIGPGSFVGLRVGLAFAVGLGIGLGVPVVGVGSLRALAIGADFRRESGAIVHAPGDCRPRLCVVDARRGEYFVAVYDGFGDSLLKPVAVRIEGVESFLLERFAPEASVVLGMPVPGFAEPVGPFAEGPHALGVAWLGRSLDPSANPAIPDYLREADAIRPDLPDSPLLLPRT